MPAHYVAIPYADSQGRRGYEEAGFGTGDVFPFTVTHSTVPATQKGDTVFHEDLPIELLTGQGFKDEAGFRRFFMREGREVKYWRKHTRRGMQETCKC